MTRMEILKHMITSLVLCAALMGCAHKTSVSDNLELAEASVNSGAYEAAQKLCDGLAAAPDFAQEPVDVKCRLALLYMKLAEQRRESENTAAALECYRAAVDDSPEDAAAAFADVAVEDLQYAAILANLMTFADEDSLIIHDHEGGDSLVIGAGSDGM